MDIRPTYSCMLGQPWIHAAGAIPSSPHQKVKFIADEQLISVMGEKELIVSTLLPDEYVEGDEEAHETSFQALEIVGTTSSEVEGGDHKPSRAAIMAAKVLISNGFEPSKGLGRKLDGMVEPVVIQENPGRSRLGYKGVARKGKPRQKVAMIKDQPSGPTEWIYPTTRELDNWTAEAILDLVPQKMLLEQEGPRLQSGTEELETINLGDGEEARDIQVGKQMPPNSRQELVALLREYSDIFAWSFQDMPGLDIAIIEHNLPLIPNAVPIRQQLRRMKPKVALKIKEEVEKQWNAGYNQIRMDLEDKKETTFITT
ncbi:hypothetical protein CR513_49163, partial [Mucuna pruriens]